MSIPALASVPDELRAKKVAEIVGRTKSLYAAMGDLRLVGTSKKDCVRFLRMLDRAIEHGFLRVYPNDGSDYATEYMYLVRLGRWYCAKSVKPHQRLHLRMPDEMRCAQAITDDRVSPPGGPLCGSPESLVGEPLPPAPDRVCARCVSAVGPPPEVCPECGALALVYRGPLGGGIVRECRACRRSWNVGPFAGYLSELGTTESDETELRRSFVEATAADVALSLNGARP